MGFMCAMFKGDFLLFMDLLRFAADFFEKTAHTLIVQEAEKVGDTWKNRAEYLLVKYC